MSEFNLTIPTILTHEGAYANNPHDPGRDTNWGISLKFMQGLPGHEKTTAADIKQLTKQQAAEIYRVEFWEKYGYGSIIDQAVATKILDIAVNIGGYHANVIAQRSVRAAIGWTLVEDGQLGIKSFSLINMAKRIMIMPALKSEAAGYYRSLDHQQKEIFLNGWLNRAYSDPILEPEKQ